MCTLNSRLVHRLSFLKRKQDESNLQRKLKQFVRELNKNKDSVFSGKSLITN